MPQKAPGRRSGGSEGRTGKLIEYAERLDEKPNCDDCRAICVETGREPKCRECLPELKPANVDAIKMWGIVRDQVIVAPMGGVVDLNHLAVWKDLEKYKVHDELKCFEKLRALHAHFQKKARDKG